MAAVVEHPIRYSAPLLLSFLDTTKNVALISCKPRWRNFDDGMRAGAASAASYVFIKFFRVTSDVRIFL